MVRELDAALTRYADIVERHVGRPVRDVPGAGAAGGLGAGLLAFLDARLVSGAQLVLDAVGFEHSLGGASLVITGEGRIDGQSIYGKLTHAVTVAARHRGVPVVAVAGMVGEGVQAMRDAGIETIETLAASAEDRPARNARSAAAHRARGRATGADPNRTP